MRVNSKSSIGAPLLRGTGLLDVLRIFWATATYCAAEVSGRKVLTLHERWDICGTGKGERMMKSNLYDDAMAKLWRSDSAFALDVINSFPGSQRSGRVAAISVMEFQAVDDRGPVAVIDKCPLTGVALIGSRGIEETSFPRFESFSDLIGWEASSRMLRDFG